MRESFLHQKLFRLFPFTFIPFFLFLKYSNSLPIIKKGTNVKMEIKNKKLKSKIIILDFNLYYLINII